MGQSADFEDFLQRISLPQKLRNDLKRAHGELRENLESDSDVKGEVRSVFLQGSYKRATIIKPAAGDKADVDVVVVTALDPNTVKARDALRRYESFAKRHYPNDNVRVQGRSVGIALPTVDLDLVVASEGQPSPINRAILSSAALLGVEDIVEADNWRLHPKWLPAERRDATYRPVLDNVLAANAPQDAAPIWIPDREVNKWVETNPAAQMQATSLKNGRTSGDFVKVVRALKCWRRGLPDAVKHPKSYPFERLLFEHCPDPVQAGTGPLERLVLTLEATVKAYPNNDTKPYLLDHGLRRDVWARITREEWQQFRAHLVHAARLARSAFEEPDEAECRRKWVQLLGSEFPAPQKPSGGNGGGGPTHRTPPAPVRDTQQRFA